MVLRSIVASVRIRMDFMTKHKITFLFIITILLCQKAFALFDSRNAYNAYQNKKFETTEKFLADMQVDNPDNPLINYNLGVTQYREKKFEEAANSFTRAGKNALEDPQLLEKIGFNLANCFYQETISLLPEDWEKTDLDKNIIEQAIAEIKKAIEQYDKTLSRNKQSETGAENEKAKINKKLSEEILKKLQQQQQQQQQDNKNNDQKDKREQNNREQNNNDQQKQKRQEQQQKDQEKNKNQKKQKQPEQNGGEKKESMKERKTRVMLAKLEQSEKELQKKLLKQKIESIKKPDNQYQKPW